MRSIKNLFIHGNTVWVYLSSGAVCQKFLKDASAEGFRLSSGSGDCVYAVHSDFTIHCVGFIGHIRLNSSDNGSGTRVVDYGKYITGADEYFYRNNH